MTERQDDGWSFDEALKRTSDPVLWDNCEKARRGRTEQWSELHKSLVKALLARVGNKLLVARSGRGQSSSKSIFVALDRASLEKMAVGQRLDSIRIYPVLRAPNAVEFLNRRGLGEAFQQYVLSDPEVRALLIRNGTPDEFKEGKAPSTMINYYWSLDQTAKNLVFRLTHTSLIVFGSADPPPSDTVLALSEALVDRIAALRELLVSGKIEATGYSSQLGQSTVPPRQWARNGISIDVSKGDLCEGESGRSSRLWTGCELRVPTSHQPNQVTARGKDRLGQEVERIITEHQIDARALGPKAAAAEVAKHMKNPPTSETAERNLQKRVIRYSDDLKGRR